MNVKLTPYIHGVPQCVSVEGLKFTNSVINIVGWVEIELSVLGIGCLTTRLWVTNSLFNKGVPIVLGSHQIKQILAQANLKRMDCWQQPWRYIYEGCAEGRWYSGRCNEELSDSDNSFEVIPKEMCQCPDRMLERLKVSTPTWEEFQDTWRSLMDRKTQFLLHKLYILCPEWWRCAQVKMVMNQVCLPIWLRSWMDQQQRLRLPHVTQR